MVFYSAFALQVSPYQKLVSINKEWVNHDFSEETISPQILYTDKDWIQEHLLLVHSNLVKVNVAHLHKNQKKARTRGLANLLEYALRKEFPQNITHAGRRPVFIDNRGVHCAVGYLLMKSGNNDISNRISTNVNYDYLRDIEDDGLNAWVKQSGFTINELAWIQPTYLRQVDFAQLKAGVNGRVNAIIPDGNGGLYAAGSFTKAGKDSVLNIAHYNNAISGFEWESIGDGVVGTIHDLIIYKGELYAAGELFENDTVPISSGVVKWDGNNWGSIGDFEMDQQNNYVLDLEIYRDTLYAAGRFKAKANAAQYYEGIAKWDGSNWVHPRINLTGEVRKLLSRNGKLVIGGDFVVNDTAIQNIVKLDSLGEIKTFMKDLKLPVNDLVDFNNELFVATDFTNAAMTDTMGFGVFRYARWVSLFTGAYTPKFATGGVNSLAVYNGKVYFGGDFWFWAFLGYQSKNLGVYDPKEYLAYATAYGSVDSTVHKLTIVDDHLCLGGDFEWSGYYRPDLNVNHVAAINLNYVNIPETSIMGVELYPNPANEFLILKSNTQHWAVFEILDLAGRNLLVNSREVVYGWEFNTSHLGSGTYVLVMIKDDLREERLFVIE